MYTKGDFHIHSTYSDGGLSPTEIVRLAKQKNVEIIFWMKIVKYME